MEYLELVCRSILELYSLSKYICTTSFNEYFERLTILHLTIFVYNHFQSFCGHRLYYIYITGDMAIIIYNIYFLSICTITSKIYGTPKGVYSILAV